MIIVIWVVSVFLAVNLLYLMWAASGYFLAQGLLARVRAIKILADAKMLADDATEADSRDIDNIARTLPLPIATEVNIKLYRMFLKAAYVLIYSKRERY